MNPISTRFGSDIGQRGAALIVALIFLLLMTLIGVSALRTTTLQERMAGHLRDANLAFQAAEAALREGEQFLQQAALPPFTGADGLLPRQDDSAQAASWNAHGWNGNSRPGPDVDGVYERPRYVIEELPPMPIEGDSEKFDELGEIDFYRVTARGFGGSEDAVAILQTTYRR